MASTQKGNSSARKYEHLLRGVAHELRQLLARVHLQQARAHVGDGGAHVRAATVLRVQTHKRVADASHQRCALLHMRVLSIVASRHCAIQGKHLNGHLRN